MESPATGDSMTVADAHLIEGVVVPGDGRGRSLGYPTANIDLVVDAWVPDDGVYACFVTVRPSDVRYGATMSVGTNPTFAGIDDCRIEAYFHDFSDDLYGRTIVVQVVARLREMRRFETVDELIAHTHDDVERSREVLHRHTRGSRA